MVSLMKTIFRDERDAEISGPSSTMASVTEIVILNLKPDADVAFLQSQIHSILSRQPGCQRVRSAPPLEAPGNNNNNNNNRILLFIDWDDMSSRKTFETSKDYYALFSDAIHPSLSSSPVAYHVPFVPFPPAALDGGAGKGSGGAVAELFHAWFPVDKGDDLVVKQRTLAALEQFIEETGKLKVPGFTGEAAYGWAMEDLPLNFEEGGEKCRAIVSVVGWESVESHRAYMGMPEYFRKERDNEGNEVERGTSTLIGGLRSLGAVEMGMCYVRPQTTEGGN